MGSNDIAVHHLNIVIVSTFFMWIQGETNGRNFGFSQGGGNISENTDIFRLVTEVLLELPP